MNCKKLFSQVFSLICLLGFLFQTQQVSVLYFRFGTTSRTVYQVRAFDFYQSIMYCPRFMELIERQQVKSILATIPKSTDDFHRQLENLTVRQILEVTPPVFDTMTSCSVRKGRMSSPVSLNERQCLDFFKITKSVTGERICYTFTPRIQATYSVGDVASSYNYLGILYQIFFKSSVAKTTFAFIISSVLDLNTTDKEGPLHSRAFQANVDNAKTFSQSNIFVSGDSIEINRLPAPYDTRCTPGHDQEVCYEFCLIGKFKTMNRLPWSGFHREKLDMKILAPTDLLNESIARLVEDSIQKCHFLCKLKPECFTKFSRTTVQEYQGYSLVISSILPSLPHMSIYSIPSLTLVEYIVQIGSSFGMWFGMSINSFDPKNWKIRKKKHKARIARITGRRLTFIVSRNGQQNRTCIMDKR